MTAPITVANFVSLSDENPKVSEEFKSKKYYNGIKFRRVIPDFMIRGDPTGTGLVDLDINLMMNLPICLTKDLCAIYGECRTWNNGSQFFITHKATPWLDGKHSVFGGYIGTRSV